MKTYLELINGVLRRMREDTVSSIYQNQSSTIISEFINDAKRQVEDSHDWTGLNTDIVVPTVDGTSSYSLTGSQNNATIIDVRDLTNNSVMRYVPSAYVRRQELINNPGTTQPSLWTEDGIDGNGDTVVKFWPVPDGAYMMSFRVTLRTDDLEAEGDTLAVPHMPVIHMAHALAAAERGDVDGQDLAMLNGLAKKSLGDAIQYDMAKQPENSIWYPV